MTFFRTPASISQGKAGKLHLIVYMVTWRYGPGSPVALWWHIICTCIQRSGKNSLFLVSHPTCVYWNVSLSEFRFRAIDKVSHVQFIYSMRFAKKRQTHFNPPPPKKKKLHFFCLCIGVLGMLLRVMLCWFNMVWNHCSPPQTDFYLVSNWQYFVMLGTYVQLKPVVLSGHIFFIRTTDTHSYQQTLCYCTAR